MQIFKINGLKKQRESERSYKEGIELIEQKHQQLEEKLLSLKIDSGGIIYGLLGLLRILKVLKRGRKVRIKYKNLQKKIQNKLENLENLDITIERVHRTGFKINDLKKTIMLKFLNYKDKDAAQDQYRQKQLWIDNIYANKDYSEGTAKLRNKLFEQAKEIRQSGKF